MVRVPPNGISVNLMSATEQALKELQDDATLLFVSGVCGEGSTKWDFSKSHLRLLTGLKGLQDEATLLFACVGEWFNSFFPVLARFD